MAQLKDLLVTGNERVLGGLSINDNTGNVPGYFYLGTGYDLNNFKSPGMYGVYNCTNQPTTTTGLVSLIVIKYSVDGIVQLCFAPNATPELYYRSWYGGNTWSSWTRMISADNFSFDSSTGTLTITT